MTREKFESHDNLNLLLSREEIDELVRTLGVKEGDNTLYFEYTDKNGEKRAFHCMKFRKIMTEKGPVSIGEYLSAMKKELGL